LIGKTVKRSVRARSRERQRDSQAAPGRAVFVFDQVHREAHFILFYYSSPGQSVNHSRRARQAFEFADVRFIALDDGARVVSLAKAALSTSAERVHSLESV